MKALVVSQNGGFVKMHESVIPVIQELGMDYTVVYSQAEAQAAKGWEWSLVEWLLPLNPRPSSLDVASEDRFLRTSPDDK